MYLESVWRLKFNQKLNNNNNLIIIHFKLHVCISTLHRIDNNNNQSC